MLQQNSRGNSTMPLLMEFTPKTQIQEGGVNERFIYDSMMQITEFDMRIVGTKSLKSVSTKSKLNKGCTVPDKKNEIDDQKQVK